MLIDTHAHVNFNAYKDDAEKVIGRALERNIWMINVGSQYTTSKRAVIIAEQYPEGVYAAIGLHPIHLSKGIFKAKLDKEEIEFQTNEESFDYDKYKELAKSSKVVAIGEVGFDYWYKPKTKARLAEFKKRQKESFLKQMELAKESDLPVIFHCRAAHNDLIDFFPNKQVRGVVHCYTGDEEQTKKYLDMGLYLGFNGLIFKMDMWHKVIKRIPIERILVETDCPYLIPLLPVEIINGQGTINRNEPLFIKYVVEKIAKIKNISYDKVAEVTTKNARELFKI